MSKQGHSISQSSVRFLYALIGALVLVAALGWGYALHADRRALQNSTFSFIDPARRFVNQDDLIVNLQPLRDALNAKYSTNPHIALYFEYLPTGANIVINKDTEFYPASLLKVPVATAVAKKIQQRDWKWTNELVLLSGDRDEFFGTLYQQPTNSTHTILDLVKRSVIESDNTAHFILLRNLETEEIEDVYEHIGLKNFFDTDGKLTARQYSVIFRMLYTSSYLDPEYSEELLSLMTKSAFSGFIEQGLPEHIPFSHKIGIAVDRSVFVDAGVVYAPNRPYILTVMVETQDEAYAQGVMKDISQMAYQYISTYEGDYR